MRRAVIGWVLVVGCSAEPRLVVDVVTDFEPGAEFASIRTEIAPVDEADEAVFARFGEDLVVSSSDDFVEGRRAGEFTELPSTALLVRVRLRRAGGELLAERLARVDVDGDRAVTLVIARSCEGVACGSGQTCVGGACESPDCDADRPERCTAPLCTADSQCPAGPGCARPVCARGTCLSVPVDELCDDGERCHPVDGCVAVASDAGARDAGSSDAGSSDAGSSDAGASDAGASDAGVPEDAGACPPEVCFGGRDEDCDGLTDCADPDCTGQGCADGQPCTFDDRCVAGACLGTPIACDSESCVRRSCNGTALCTESAQREGLDCDDGNLCTHTDRCGIGVCRGTTVRCPGATACVTYACDGTASCAPTVAPQGTTCGAPNLRCCGLSCVNISDDDMNCGGCGLACNTAGIDDCHSGICSCSSQIECPSLGSGWACSIGRCRCTATAACSSGQTCSGFSSSPGDCSY